MVGQWLWSLSSLWVGLVLRGLIVTELACLLAAQQQEQQELQQAAAARLAAVKQQAVAGFWELLQDFVALRVAPEAWLPELAPDHPFLRVAGDRLVVHRVAPAPGAE